jgi:hypothetical protein
VRRTFASTREIATGAIPSLRDAELSSRAVAAQLSLEVGDPVINEFQGFRLAYLERDLAIGGNLDFDLRLFIEMIRHLTLDSKRGYIVTDAFLGSQMNFSSQRGS